MQLLFHASVFFNPEAFRHQRHHCCPVNASHEILLDGVAENYSLQGLSGEAFLHSIKKRGEFPNALTVARDRRFEGC